MHLYFVFVHAFKIIMYGNVFLISIFLHQDSRTWCVLLFFLFFIFFVKFLFVCMIKLWQCTLVLLFSRLLRVLFVCLFVFVYLHRALRTPSCFNCLHLQHHPFLLHFNLSVNEILHWRLSNEILAPKLWLQCNVSFVSIMVMKNLLTRNDTTNKPQISSIGHHHITLFFMCNIMKHNILKLGCNTKIYH